jgi:SAM-dependent methyltransferase
VDDVNDYAARYEAERSRSKSLMCWTLFQRKIAQHQKVQSILDIGCGEGSFLNYPRQAGMRTAGIEISVRAAAVAVQAGHEILCGSVPEVAFPEHNAFDAVVMWDTLEHLRFPGQALLDAFRYLRPSGAFFATVPMMGSIYDRLGLAAHTLSGGRFDQLVRMCWSRDHLFRFTPAGMKMALRAIGFGDVQTESTLLLSLENENYAGGAILPSWSGNRTLDRAISVFGVRLATVLRLHNKMIIVAKKPSSGSDCAAGSPGRA